MAASLTYFLGAKKIHSKKKDEDFFCVTLLSRNNWGDWETFTKFCDESLFNDVVQNVAVGFPVICSFDMGGSLIQCIAHDTVPPLDLPDN